MGLFGGSKSSSSSNTTNYTTTTSQSLGDLSTGNIQAAGNVEVQGFYGDDLDNFLGFLDKSYNQALQATTTNIADSNRRIQEAFTDAYSGSSGTLTKLRPVLIIGACVLALAVAPKLLRSF